MNDRYRTMPAPPDEISAVNVIRRMLGGIGFRFYWATDGLSEETYAFVPREGVRSIGETVEHIWDLLHWTYRAIEPAGLVKPVGAQQLRQSTLELVANLEDMVSEMSIDDLAAIQLLKQRFWPVINGPLSDVLTHIGQIATLRRIAGSPVPDSNPFEETPPPGS